MSKYTTTLYNIRESGINIFDFTYPIYDESYRKTLEDNIINYYLFDEIAYDSVEKFKIQLKNKMLLIMPNYNKLYKEYAETDFNILYNIEMIEEYEHSVQSNATAENENITKDKSLFTTYPTTQLDELDTNGNYGDSGENARGEQSGKQKSDNTMTESYTRKNRGSSAGMPFSRAFKQYREDYLFNIDMQICEDLENLFLKVM